MDDADIHRRIMPAPAAILLGSCLLVALLIFSTATADAAPRPQPLALEHAVTDNYKASFNADPHTRELRTWLTVRNARMRNGMRIFMHPSENAAPGEARFPAHSIRVRNRRGVTGRIVMRRLSGPADPRLFFRVGPQPGQWGPLVMLTNANQLDRQPVRILLEVRRGQRIHARTVITYRADARVRATPIEANGPGGRWFVGPRRTPTNVEVGQQ